MSNELIAFQVELPAVVSDDELTALDKVSKATEYLPRIQLYTKGKPVDKKLIVAGNWGIPLPGGDEITTLGEEIDVLVFAARTKAMDTSDKEAIIVVYDHKDSEFQRIQNAAKSSKLMWGPEFFVAERSTGKLYSLFFGNKSGRQEAGKMKPFLPTKDSPQPKVATLKNKYKESVKYDSGWHVPVVVRCSEAFDTASVKFDNEELMKELDKFRNPKKSAEKVEEGEEGEGGEGGRAR